MSEDTGRKRLQDLSKSLQEKLTASGDAPVNRRALKTIERLARDLTGESAMPGLRLWRDAAGKFRLQRPPRNAEIALEWQRDITAMVLTAEKFGEPRRLVRYVYEPTEDIFRRMEGEGELHDDLTDTLVEYLYPEAR
ncbi:hypothetical protein [Chondromyces crocatus]|uniref:Uncharacterized protein n=1 Tax=Chondromyces crocatus TaxID=52 RepID=A0A0K1E918_CHOCO|nr:hypothetical protein [Chondromyces crocatus]AKT37167.1 uncharacterized protein CMC5_012970 [Chondromyces crocatus]